MKYLTKLARHLDLKPSLDENEFKEKRNYLKDRYRHHYVHIGRCLRELGYKNELLFVNMKCDSGCSWIQAMKPHLEENGEIKIDLEWLEKNLMEIYSTGFKGRKYEYWYHEWKRATKATKALEKLLKEFEKKLRELLSKDISEEDLNKLLHGDMFIKFHE